MDFELPRGAYREYLIVFGVAAVYIGTVPIGEPCIVGATRDLERTSQAMRDSWPWSEISAAFWVKDRATADAIAVEVKRILPANTEGRLTITGERARNEIERVAAEWKIPLTNHDAAMARVHSAVRRVAEYIDNANSTGELAWFNSAFRLYRLEAKKKFGHGMFYAEALARLRKAITKRLIIGEVIDCGPDMLPEIFPKLRHSQRRKVRSVDRQKNRVSSSRTPPRPEPRAFGSGFFVDHRTTARLSRQPSRAGAF
jgi:hypothetical protein